MQKNNAMFQIDGWMARLPFVFNCLKALLMVLPLVAIFVYFYLNQASPETIKETELVGDSSYLAGIGVITLIYYAMIFCSIVKRLRDILGKDIKSPYILPIIIIIGLSLPVVGFITGLVLTFYPGIFSKEAAA